jgi:hypothetical protein
MSADRWLTWGLCLLAIALATVSTWHGPGLSIDAINYLATGINLAEGRGLRLLGDQPLTAFPPGLPLLAALGEALGIGAANMLRLVSVLAFGAIVALGHRLLTRIVSHRGLVMGTTALLAVSPALLSLTRMAISEPPFIVVTLAFLVVLGGVCERATLHRRDVALLATLSSLAFLFRYIGLALIPVGGIALLLCVRPLDRRTWLRIISLAALSAVVPVACMLRNSAADGTFMGGRLPSQDSPADVAHRAAITFGQWIYPMHDLPTRSVGFLGYMGMVLGVAAAVLTFRHRSNLSDRAQAYLACCATFVLVYLACLVGAALRTPLAPLNTRLLGPAYVPTVVMLAAGAETALARLPSRAWRVGAGAILATVIAVHALSAADEARDTARNGVNYDQPDIKESGLADKTADVVAGTPGAAVYSNDPYALWVGTGIRPIFWAPRTAGFRGAKLTGDVQALEWRVACSWPTTYLAVYVRSRERVMSLDELSSSLDVTRVAVAEDGALFRLRNRSEQDCSADPPTCTLESVPWRCEGDG